MKRFHTIGSLLIAGLLASSPAGFTGETSLETGKTTVAPEPAPSNPLSFLDGAVVFDVQERVRFEAHENHFDFNNKVDSLTDDAWVLQRFRIGVAVKPTSWLKFYAQTQDSREWDSDRPDFPGALAAEGDDSFDLRQAYVEIGDPKQFPVTLTLGRQILSYGDERLIGSFDWNNIGRTFDAAKLRYHGEGWSLDAFAATVVRPTKSNYNQSDIFNGAETHNDQVFSGLYFSSTALVPVQTTDLYVLHLHENTVTPNNDTNFFTLGMRVKSKPGAFAHSEPAPESDGKSMVDSKSVAAPAKPKPVGLDYEFEGAWQTGEVRSLDLSAFAVHAGLGYTLDCWGLPRFSAQYNFGSGDENPLDGNSQTFQNLFPTNHKFYGYMDIFAWQNMHNPGISFEIKPVKDIVVKLDGHAFWVATNEDTWNRANGVTPVRPLSRNAGTYAGSEVDLTVTWKVCKNLDLMGGYSHFFTGDYLKASGRSDDADFGYVQATISF
jgi:hypothetical protein